MSELRELLVLYYNRLGLGPVAEGYLDCLERMNAACAAWYRERPGPAPHWELPDPDSPVMISGGLDAVDHLGICGNERARDFVRFIDERTNFEGTLLQLQVLLQIQALIAEAKATSPGGSA